MYAYVCTYVTETEKWAINYTINDYHGYFA